MTAPSVTRFRCPRRAEPGYHDTLDLALPRPLREVSRVVAGCKRCRCGAEMVLVGEGAT